MLSIDHILHCLKSKQYNLPKSFYEDYDELEIENLIKYKEFLSEGVKEEKSNLYKEEKDEEKSIRSIENIKLIRTYDSVQDIFGDCCTTFVHSKSNQSLIFRFLDSIFSILQMDFLLQSYQDKQFIFTQWIKKLDEELIGKDRYYEFNYVRNRTMKRANIQLALNQALMGKCDYDIFDTIIQYTIDMLHMSVVILNIKNNRIDYTSSKIFHYKNIFQPLNPLGVILYDHGVYYPLLRKNNVESFFQYSCEDDREKMKKIYKYMNCNDFSEKIVSTPSLLTFEKVVVEKDIQKEVIEEEVIQKEVIQEEVIQEEEKIIEEIKKSPKYQESEVKKMKVEDLRNLCIQESISIKKISEKSGKDIFKLKDELIADLLIILV